VTARSAVELPPHAPRMPVILDTGHSYYFSIQERHLADWARLQPGQLPARGTIRVDDERFPRHSAAVWIHRNQPGFRDRLADEPAYRLDLPDGIALYPSAGGFPRLPLLGLRALVRNQLHFTMDPERCTVNLRTPDWRT